MRERDERHERLMEAMASLKPRALEILLLHDTSMIQRNAQIAALLGTSRGTIAVALFRIRARLRTLLHAAAEPGGGLTGRYDMTSNERKLKKPG